jgi:hypothetical protein
MIILNASTTSCWMKPSIRKASALLKGGAMYFARKCSMVFNDMKLRDLYFGNTTSEDTTHSSSDKRVKGIRDNVRYYDSLGEF